MLEKRVNEFLSRHLPPASRILVGLSGGADSVALLLALHTSGAECIAAHCNFHLRSEESDRDRIHCERLCERLNIKLLVKDFDVETRRAQTSESVEMACRALRYDWWNKLIDSGIADYIAVGHHREDNVETFFLNLMRGSGITGLKGMLPVNGRIIRPLLETSRDEIEQYLADNNCTWVTDRTNLENIYTRNRLRNVVIPALEEQLPGITNSIVRSLAVMRENYDLYSNAVQEYAKMYVERNDAGEVLSLDINRLIAGQTASHAIIHELLSPTGLTHSQINDIYACAKGESTNASAGQMFKTNGTTFILQRGVLTRQSSNFDSENESVERIVDLRHSPFRISRITLEEFEDIRRKRAFDSDSIYLDSGALDGDPVWTMRQWRQGDRLEPFGMKGSRLVSDIYSDAKLTADQKRSTRLLFRNETLIWVIGLRASRHFPVTRTTKEIIRLTID